MVTARGARLTMKSGPRGARATRTSRALEPSTRGRRTRAPRAREDPRGAASRPESPPTKSSRPTTTPRRRGVARRGNGDCVCSRLRCSSPRRARGSTPPRSPPWTSRRATARCSSPSRGESSGESHLARPARIQPHERRRVTTPRRQVSRLRNRTRDSATPRVSCHGAGAGAAARLPVTAHFLQEPSTAISRSPMSAKSPMRTGPRGPHGGGARKKVPPAKTRNARGATRFPESRSRRTRNEKRLYLPLPAKKAAKKSSKKASSRLMSRGSRRSRGSRGSRRSRRSRIHSARRRRRRISMRLFVRRGVPPRARRRRRPGASPRCGDSSRRAPRRRTPRGRTPRGRTTRPSERIRRNRAVRRRATTTRARELSARDFLKKRHSRVRADSRRERSPAPKRPRRRAP